MYALNSDFDLIYKNIVDAFCEYLGSNNLKSLVVGLSGGIDSALTAALASEAIKRVGGIKLIGRSIPIETNKEDEIRRGEMIGKNFCDSFEIRDLTTAYINLKNELLPEERIADESDPEKIRRGNIKARVRMVYLFDLAHYNSGMVLSTDNFTELLLGFWTLHGDVGNYGMIQYLWKTEVYGLAKYLADKYGKEGDTGKKESLEACIEATPTDGLGITSSDFDQIGVNTYLEADQILIDYLNGKTDNVEHPVIERYMRSEFKRVDPQNIDRDTILGIG